MRRSEFFHAVDVEFGAHGTTLLHDLVLSRLGCTAMVAVHDGVPPREVWLALCEETDVPAERRHGAGRREPRR